MNTCAECKHSQRIPMTSPELVLCNAPWNKVGIDPVSGNDLFRAHRCTEQREWRIFQRSKYCGPHASWWESK